MNVAMSAKQMYGYIKSGERKCGRAVPDSAWENQETDWLLFRVGGGGGESSEKAEVYVRESLCRKSNQHDFER